MFAFLAQKAPQSVVRLGVRIYFGCELKTVLDTTAITISLTDGHANSVLHFSVSVVPYAAWEFRLKNCTSLVVKL